MFHLPNTSLYLHCARFSCNIPHQVDYCLALTRAAALFVFVIFTDGTAVVTLHFYIVPGFALNNNGRRFVRSPKMQTRAQAKNKWLI